MLCLTNRIYNSVMEGHVNRLNHVQCVFAHPLPLPLSHTLTLPPSCVLLCFTACSDNSLFLPVSSAHLHALLLSFLCISLHFCLLLSISFALLATWITKTMLFFLTALSVLRSSFCFPWLFLLPPSFSPSLFIFCTCIFLASFLSS